MQYIFAKYNLKMKSIPLIFSITSGTHTRACSHSDSLKQNISEELNTSLYSSTTPSHLVGFGSHPLSPQSRNQAMTFLSVQQRTLWRLSYFQPSTTTRFHPQTNTVISRQVSTKGNIHIVHSVSLLT